MLHRSRQPHPGRALRRYRERAEAPGRRGLEQPQADPAGRLAEVRLWRRIPRLQPGCGEYPAGCRAAGRLREVQGIHRAGGPAPSVDDPRPVAGEDRRAAAGARRGGAAGSHLQALRCRRDFPRRAVAGGPRGAGRGDEHPGRSLQLRRGRRGPGALRHAEEFEDQAGGYRPLRRDPGIPGQRRGPADQGGPGRQARRGRPVAGRQGQRPDRPPALCGARRDPDLAAAAPRHLLHRRPGTADLRPQAGQPAGAGIGEAGIRAGRRHHRRRRGQGLCGPDHHLRLRRRYRCLADHLDQVRRLALGTGPGGNPPDPARQRPARQGPGADRWRPEDRPGRDQGGHSRRRELRLRHRADDRPGLQVPAHLPPEQLRHRRGDAERQVAQGPLHRHHRDGDQLLHLHRHGNPRVAGAPRRAQPGRADRPHRPAGDPPRRDRQAAESGSRSVAGQ